MQDAWGEPNLSHPHNFILDFWTRLGIWGVLLFLVMQIGFWRINWSLYRRFRTQNDIFLLAVNIGLMGSMLDLLGHGLVDNSVYVVDLAYVFALLLALPIILQNLSAIDADP